VNIEHVQDAVPISFATGRRYAVLRALAEGDRPLNKYGILKHLPKKVGSKPTLLKVIDELKDEKFIKVDHVDLHARGNIGHSEHYDLRLRGFAYLVSVQTNSTPDKDSSIAAMKPLRERALLKRIVSKYAGFLPAVFELWPSFVKAGIEEEAWYRLGFFCSSLERKLRAGELSEERRKQLTKFVNEKGIEHTFAFNAWVRTDEKEWFDAIHKNKVLREVAVKLLRNQVGEFRRKQSQLASIEKGLQELIGLLQRD
jgi:hypothetical protein